MGIGKLTAVAFGAHPDPFDMPYQAGGTLAKYAKRALHYRVTWAHDLLPLATLPPIED
ncbi:MAG: hypothetical protein ACRERD_11995 [Candidatus Binatia bacterium]